MVITETPDILKNSSDVLHVEVPPTLFEFCFRQNIVTDEEYAEVF